MRPMLLDDAEGQEAHALGLANRRNEVRPGEFLPMHRKIVLGESWNGGGEESQYKSKQRTGTSHFG